jgi:outer membrane protein TolC
MMPRPRWLVGLLLGTATAVHAQKATIEALTLEQCVALALERNPAIAIEQERLHVAEADHAVARSVLLPRLSGSASYNRLEPDRLSPAGLVLPGATSPQLFVEESFAGLRLRQVVIDGRSWPAARAAAKGIDAQRSNVAASRSETVFLVTLAYARLVEAQNLVGIAQEAHTRQTAFEKLTSDFYDAGKVARLDKLRAESQRLDAERALVAAVESESLAQQQLLRTLGVTEDRPVRATDELRRTLEPSPSEASVLSSAFAGNPHIERLAAQAHQADAAVWAARGEHLPELSLQATYGYRRRDIGGGAGEYTVGAFLEFPLFSGLATKAVVERANARRREIDAARRAFEDQLRVDVRQALTSWRIAAESARFAATSVEMNRESLAAATSLYQSGKATALDVLTAQSDLTRAQGLLVQAFGDYAIAQASVERVTGKMPSGQPEERR